MGDLLTGKRNKYDCHFVRLFSLELFCGLLLRRVGCGSQKLKLPAFVECVIGVHCGLVVLLRGEGLGNKANGALKGAAANVKAGLGLQDFGKVVLSIGFRGAIATKLACVTRD